MTILVCYSCVAKAQNSISKQRRALEAALTTVEDYSVWSTIADAEAYYEFLDLFVNKESMVYNDLLGIKRGESLTAEEYANTMQRGLRNKKIFIKNVKNEGISSENGQTRIRLSLDKAISYVDTCGTYYSSSEFYETDHHLSFILVYDEQKRVCKIESISGNIASKKSLPSQYVVFASEDDRDVNLSYKNQPLQLNSYHQTFIEGTKSSIKKSKFTYSDQSVELKPIYDECHMSMKYRVRRLRLKPHYDIGMGNAYTVEGLGNMLNDKNSMSSFGLDFGYMLTTKRHFGLGIFTGFNMSRSRLDFSLSNSDYSFQTNADIDGDSYIRHYQNLNLTQTVRLQDISIPLYFDLEFYIAKAISFYADLGIRVNLNMTHKIDDTKGSAYTYGIYPQYENMLLNENWPYNGFGNHQLGQADLDNTDIVDLKSTSIDLMGNAGFRFNIPDMPFSIDLGVSYLMGLGEVISTSTPVEQYSNVSRPIVYNTISGENSVEHVRNLTEAVKSVKRSSLRLSLGLIWKF